MPVWTSSQMSSAPVASHSSRAASMYAFVAGVIPPSPCSGSSMIAASDRRRKGLRPPLIFLTSVRIKSLR